MPDLAKVCMPDAGGGTKNSYQKQPPGFDLTTHNFAGGYDTTRPRRPGQGLQDYCRKKFFILVSKLNRKEDFKSESTKKLDSSNW
jgi:hypothetical protein